ncbi:unnamed protein product [Anisakis simplex]|uniref:Uncharacterized protein n=1 Tax=Anisakis simplex TaxID=6269 RepID=A0A3P6PQM8_ANISI|nr:unnamed protein product [Anisakis simplex]
MMQNSLNVARNDRNDDRNRYEQPRQQHATTSTNVLLATSTPSVPRCALLRSPIVSTSPKYNNTAAAYSPRNSIVDSGNSSVACGASELLMLQHNDASARTPRFCDRRSAQRSSLTSNLAARASKFAFRSAGVSSSMKQHRTHSPLAARLQRLGERNTRNFGCQMRHMTFET